MDNNEKVICSADIRTRNIKILMIIWIIIATIILIFTSLPKKYKGNNGYESWNQTDYYLCSGHFLSKTEYIDGLILTDWSTYQKYYYHKPGEVRTHFNGGELFFGILVTFLLFTTPFLLYLLLFNSKAAKKSSLVLSEKGINGMRKKIFSLNKLDLPIDKVDNVMVSENIIDKIRTGKTLTIRSASGVVRFPWVQNADEFVKATLSEIEKFKKTLPKTDESASPAQNTTDNDTIAKLTSLKQMMESDLITQEEFEQKRKEILSKM